VLWELGMHGQYIAQTNHRLTRSGRHSAEGRARTGSQLERASLMMATGDPLEATTLCT